MGSDNLHHKRKARKNNEIKRQKAKREPYQRVLIVCEDSKSTPTYLATVRDELKLSTANITICGEECGSAPSTVIHYAKELTKRDHEYEQVYCVIDRDKHPNFLDVLTTARDNNIDVIVSIPCFEYWLLLHFEYTTRPFQAAQGSDCEEVIKSLNQALKKNHLPNYKKDNSFLQEYYPLLKETQATAIRNAKRREQECHLKKLENPCTQMHLLIEYLNQLKGNK